MKQKRLVTIDVTWLHRYDLESKQHSKEWKRSDFPQPEILRVQKSAGEILASIFFNGIREHTILNC